MTINTYIMAGIVALTVAAVASSSAAQNINLKAAEVSYQYDNFDFDELPDDITQSTFSGVADIGFTPSFGVQFGGSFSRADYDDGPADVSADFRAFDATAYVEVGSDVEIDGKLGIQVGVLDFDDLSIDGSTFDLDEQAWAYGGAFVVDYEKFGFGMNLGTIDFDSFDELDVYYFIFGADYAFTENWEAYGNYGYTDFSIDGVDGDLDVRTVEIGAKYYAGPVELYGSIGQSRLKLTGAPTVDGIKLSVGITLQLDGKRGGTNRNRLFSSYRSPL